MNLRKRLQILPTHAHQGAPKATPSRGVGENLAWGRVFFDPPAAATPAGMKPADLEWPELEKVEFDWRHTFRVMALRRVRRRLAGSIQKKDSKTIMTLSALLLTVGVLSVTLTRANNEDASAAFDSANVTFYGESEIRISLRLGLLENISLLGLAVFVLFFAVRLVETIRLCVYWLAIGLMAYIVMQVLCGADNQCGHRTRYSYLITSATAAMVTLTIALWVFQHVLYPYALRTASCCLRDVQWWWSIHLSPSDEFPETDFGYRPSTSWPKFTFLARFLRRPARRFGYNGELDSQGRPHGYGAWHDTDDFGETLSGIWHHGEPLGPFRATEYATGWTVASVRVAFCHNRAERKLDEFWWKAQRSPDGLMWGVAAVECSIAGGFYKNLPHIRVVAGPESHRSAMWCLEHLMTPQPTARTREDAELAHSVVVTAGPSGLHISGYAPVSVNGDESVVLSWMPPPELMSSARMRLGGSLVQPQPSIHVGLNSTALLSSSKHRATANQEAVVFIHGFNCPVSDGLKRIAQLWVLGEFPPNLKPFVWSWPTARDLTYFSAKRWCDDNVTMNEDFTAFIASLCDAGFERIHMLTHSMGCMILFSALQYAPFRALFRPAVTPPPGTSGMSPAPAHDLPPRDDLGRDLDRPPDTASHRPPARRLTLATTLIMNPDSSLDKFLRRDFAALRQLCDHITMYADLDDNALGFSERFNRWQALGKHPFELSHNVGKAHAGGRSQSAALSSTVTTLLPPPQAPMTAKDLPATMLEALRAVRLPGRVVRGAPPPAPPGKMVVPLDLDVIECSWMDGNTHAMRHMNFNINRWAVDDLREIFTTRKRARYRTSRLVHRFRNVFSFMAAPSHVKNP